MGEKFKKTKRKPIRKRLNLFSNKSSTIAEMGFRSGLKHQLKKQDISVHEVETKSKKQFNKPFMALTEKQMEKILKEVRK